MPRPKGSKNKKNIAASNVDYAVGVGRLRPYFVGSI